MAIYGNPSFSEFCEALYDSEHNHFHNENSMLSLDALKYLYDFYTIGTKLDKYNSKDLIPNGEEGRTKDSKLEMWLRMSICNYEELKPCKFAEKIEKSIIKGYFDTDYLNDYRVVKLNNGNYLTHIDV